MCTKWSNEGKKNIGVWKWYLVTTEYIFALDFQIADTQPSVGSLHWMQCAGRGTYFSLYTLLSGQHIAFFGESIVDSGYLAVKGLEWLSSI